MFSIDYDIILEDNKEPFKPFLKSEIIPISSSIFKTYYKEMSEIRLNSDESLLFPSYEETKTYKFTQSREVSDLRENHKNFPGTFSQINFIANSGTQIYYRTYRKLFEIIVQIGGFFNGVIYTATIILYLYSNNIILWHCIYSIISTNELQERFNNPILRRSNTLKIKLHTSNNNENNNENMKSNILHIKKTIKKAREEGINNNGNNINNNINNNGNNNNNNNGNNNDSIQNNEGNVNNNSIEILRL